MYYLLANKTPYEHHTPAGLMIVNRYDLMMGNTWTTMKTVGSLTLMKFYRLLEVDINGIPIGRT